MDGGYKNKRRKRKPRTTVEDPPADVGTTCSICQSRLALFSELRSSVSLARLNPPSCKATLQCVACGSDLTPLAAIAK